MTDTHSEKARNNANNGKVTGQAERTTQQANNNANNNNSYIVSYNTNVSNANSMLKMYGQNQTTNLNDFITDAIKYATETNIRMEEYTHHSENLRNKIANYVFNRLRTIQQNIKDNRSYAQSQQIPIEYNDNNQSQCERRSKSERMKNSKIRKEIKIDDDQENGDENEQDDDMNGMSKNDNDDDDKKKAIKIAEDELMRQQIYITYDKQMPNMILILTPHARLNDATLSKCTEKMQHEMYMNNINIWEQHNGKINWSNLGIKSQYDICKNLRQTMQENETPMHILHKVATQANLYWYIRKDDDDQAITMSLKNKEMEKIDLHWEKKLSNDLQNIRYLISPFETIVINRKKQYTDKKKSEYVAASLTQIPSSATTKNDGSLMDLDEIENNILEAIEMGCDVLNANDVARVIFYPVRRKRTNDNFIVKHRAKLLLNPNVQRKNIMNKIVSFGIEEAKLDIFKTDAHRRAEEHHPVMGVICICSYCQHIGHTKSRCRIYKAAIDQSKYKMKMNGMTDEQIDHDIKNIKITPICHKCNDLDIPHYSSNCRNAMYCGRCGGKDHTTNDYIKCPKIMSECHEITVFLKAKYGEKWEENILDIMAEYPNGINRYIRNMQPINQNENEQDKQKRQKCNYDRFSLMLHEYANADNEKGSGDEDDDDLKISQQEKDVVSTGMDMMESTMPTQMRLPKAARLERKRGSQQMNNVTTLTKDEESEFQSYQQRKKRKISHRNDNNSNNNNNNNSRSSSMSSMSNEQNSQQYTLNRNRRGNIPRIRNNNYTTPPIFLNGEELNPNHKHHNMNGRQRL